MHTEVILGFQVRPVPAPLGWRSPTDEEVRAALDPGGRLAYLAAMHERVTAAALAYVVQHPRGDEVVLAVLTELKQADVEAAAGDGKKTARLVRDCEDLTIALLARVVGCRSVFSGPKRAKSRLANLLMWPSAWAERYRAIRVAVPPREPERLLLDTVSARKVIQGDQDAIDLVRLERVRGDHPISLTVPTAHELTRSLREGAIPFDLWQAHIPVLHQVLDPECPIVPGEPKPLARPQAPSWYRALWELLRKAQHLGDLTAGVEYLDEAGQRMFIAVDPAVEVVADYGNRYLERLTSLISSQERPSLEDLLGSIRFILESLGDASVAASDLALRASARRALEVIQAGASSPKRKNDGIDDAQLQYVEKGILCTQDNNLKRRADGSESFDAWRVMSPDDLFRWLESDLITFGPMF